MHLRWGRLSLALWPRSHRNVATAARLMVHELERIEPNPEAHAAYQFYVNQYIDTYPRVQD